MFRAQFNPGLIAACATIATSLFFGGAAAEMSTPQVAVISIALASGLALLARGGMQDLELPWLVLVAIIAVMALPLLQLIPLPPEIWRGLPGRAAETAIVDLAGGGRMARPLALNPNTNLQLFASLTALTAFALTVARLDEKNILRLLRIVLGLAFIQFFIGAVQFTTAGAFLDLFGNSHKGWLLGTFANRNHAALFFASCIIFTAALFEDRQSSARPRSAKLQRAILITIMLLWALAIIGTGSRSGIVLAFIAIAIGTYIAMWGMRLPVWTWVAGATSIVVGIAVVMTSSRIQRLIERYDNVGDDQRWSIWTNSVKIIIDYMPWGTGFGSFKAVYNKIEPFNELLPTYANNAHNDYLELLIETGFSGTITFVALFVMIILLVVRGVRLGVPQVSRHCVVGGGVIFLFACHSVFDYPSRRMATAVVLFFAFGLLLRQFGRDKSNTE